MQTTLSGVGTVRSGRCTPLLFHHIYHLHECQKICFLHQRSPVSFFLGIGFYFSASSHFYLPGCFSSYLSSTFTEAGEGCWYFRIKLVQWSDCGYQVNDNALHLSTKWPMGWYRLAAWWLGTSAINGLRQTGPVIYAFPLDSFPLRADFWNSSFVTSIVDLCNSSGITLDIMAASLIIALFLCCRLLVYIDCQVFVSVKLPFTV